MKVTSLNGTWDLIDEPIETPAEDAPRVAARADGWLAQPVPGDIHQGLVAAGRIAEPLLGLNSFDCAWTEQRSWWFRKRFPTDPDWPACDAVELELDGLDSNAAIFLNGARLGGHRNAFYPFVADIKPRLAAAGAENELLVRLTAGVEDVTPDMAEPLGVPVSTEAANGRPERGDPRRVFARKPQYSFGWDWSPRVATTAIAGGATVRAFKAACIRDVRVQPLRVPDAGITEAVDVRVTVTVDFLHYFKTGDGTVSVVLRAPDGGAKGQRWTARRDVLLRSGLNTIDFVIRVERPRLWWPNGLGEPARYAVQAELRAGGERAASPVQQVGLRFVELIDRDLFAFVVNDYRIFCKGADWIPADTVYARTSPDKYEALVRQARLANFNMLRVWGGGLYEPEAFYEACDRHGILLWHDFMFACAPYPDHLEWFRREVEKEADYQTRRLRNHACLALWSGSNENNWGFDEWWHGRTRGGAYLYNYLLPRAVRDNCPEIPYWNGSPYGGETPNAPEVGDRHHWFDCMMNPDMNKRITPEEYDQCDSKFVSEYGYIGAPVKETVTAYLDGAPFDRQGAVWQHHNNTFEKNTVDAGIRKHYADPEAITLDEYFLYSGLTQGLMYGYSLESLRSKPECHGGLFWMYADCWGEVGWTIVDSYVRRKPSWYFVRRALAPVRLILRRNGAKAVVTMANDTPEAVKGRIEVGWMALDGSDRQLKAQPFTCLPLSRAVVAEFGLGQGDPTRQVWLARVRGRDDILPATLRAADARQLRLVRPQLTASIQRASAGQWDVRVGSDVYAHAVHLVLPAGAMPEDDYFDLLPGESRVVRVAGPGRLSAKEVGVVSVVASTRT